MNVFERIAIGTANWGKPYGHRGVVCPRAEQEKIIAYCQSAGIDTIHTKQAYGVDLSWLPTAFEVIQSDAGRNVSYYNPADIDWVEVDVTYDVLQVPYSPFNRHWEAWFEEYTNFAKEIHVRSIFCQGKVFTSEEPVFVRFRQYSRELRLPVGTLCILFCLLNPHVDKVVIGVDSEQQLRDNLRFFHRLGSFAVEDQNVIDPRRWI